MNDTFRFLFFAEEIFIGQTTTVATRRNVVQVQYSVMPLRSTTIYKHLHITIKTVKPKKSDQTHQLRVSPTYPN